MKYLPKQFLSCFLSVSLLCGGVGLIATQTGCTTSQQTTTYTTLASIGTAVDNAEKAYTDLVVTGKISSATLAQESKIYNDFQAAYRVAVAAAQGSTLSVAPQNVLDLGNAVVSFVAQIQK